MTKGNPIKYDSTFKLEKKTTVKIKFQNNSGDKFEIKVKDGQLHVASREELLLVEKEWAGELARILLYFENTGQLPE